MFHLSLPVGAVAEIKAVAAETPGEDIEVEPHGDGENAAAKGEGKMPKIMTLEDHRTIVLNPEEEEEETMNGGKLEMIPPGESKTADIKPDNKPKHAEENIEEKPKNAPKINKNKSDK